MPSTPILELLSELPPAAVAELPPDLAPNDGVALFAVTRDGWWSGFRFRAGEVVVCRGEARHGDVTVLVARGLGRPRFGTVEGVRFRGDAGEPCHPGRWQSAGRVVARYQRAAAHQGAHRGDSPTEADANAGANRVVDPDGAADGWVIELIERGAWSVEAVGGPHVPDRAAAEGRGERPSAAQLPLFAGVA
ncbi:MAG: hypothetical protein ABMB14_30915 [Myxococcota bacterium]